MEQKHAHILVLGAGFGGLTFCQNFRARGAQLTLVDRHNHHLFQPLLYQVATAGLSAPDIAQPIRSILSGREDIAVVMSSVQAVDLKERRVTLKQEQLSYDYLVLALGGVTSYFGHPEWAEFAPGLKTLADALYIRERILKSFELAENTPDAQEQQRLMTIVVVGGGPTGVEVAGACAELARIVLRRDFKRIDPAKARVILLEGASRLLLSFDSDLAEKAEIQLRHLGVEVHYNSRVQKIIAEEVQLPNEIIRAANIIWGAGVQAHPLTGTLGVELDRAGRVKVNPDLSVPGHPEVFCIGDMAVITGKDGRPVPGVSPAAMQEARHIVKIISAEIEGGLSARPAFRYFDKGSMATIGRSAAVAQIRWLKLSGFSAWLAWLFVHLIFLIGFRNKLAVLLSWAYSYFTYKRGARIITKAADE